jgi:hypothetical protein
MEMIRTARFSSNWLKDHQRIREVGPPTGPKIEISE